MDKGSGITGLINVSLLNQMTDYPLNVSAFRLVTLQHLPHLLAAVLGTRAVSLGKCLSFRFSHSIAFIIRGFPNITLRT